MVQLNDTSVLGYMYFGRMDYEWTSIGASMSLKQ